MKEESLLLLSDLQKLINQVVLIDYTIIILGGDVMKLDTIGKNIRKFRLARKLRQEDLAEKTDLTTNYIGMVERGEKIPSLETFIKIVNALGVSSDMVLTDVLETGYTVKNSMLNEKLEKLVPEDRNRIYEVIDTLVKQSKQILP